MVEITDTQAKPSDDAAQNAAAQAPSVPASGGGEVDKTRPRPVEVKGLFNNFTSAYWAFAIPLLSFGRYLSESVTNLFFNPKKGKRNVLAGKVDPDLTEKIHATMAGSIMTVGTAFFMERTYQDMRNEFAETLGWEFGKKPEDVTMNDMRKSKNTLIEDARSNFIKYNLRRFAVITPFFGGYPAEYLDELGKKLAAKGGKLGKLGGALQYAENYNSKTAVALGTASVAGYLVSDVLSRKESFFERLQKFRKNKINQTESVGEHITANDLINLYERSTHDKRSTRPLAAMSTPEWRNEEALFGRMADLMNQTYGNVPAKEHANFGLSKFIYMVGNGLLKSDSLEKNLAYVEVANTYGIPAVREVDNAVKNGADVRTALAAYPVCGELLDKEIPAAPQPETKSFAASVSPKARPEMLPATHAERAATGAQAGLAVGG